MAKKDRRFESPRERAARIADYASRRNEWEYNKEGTKPGEYFKPQAGQTSRMSRIRANAARQAAENYLNNRGEVSLFPNSTSPGYNNFDDALEAAESSRRSYRGVRSKLESDLENAIQEAGRWENGNHQRQRITFSRPVPPDFRPGNNVPLPPSFSRKTMGGAGG